MVIKISLFALGILFISSLILSLGCGVSTQNDVAISDRLTVSGRDHITPTDEQNYGTASPTFSPDPLRGRANVAVFAGGCFWGVEYYFMREKGVKRVTSGYTGGIVSNPTYEDVLTKRSGHLEAVEVEFDPKLTDFETLARLFFEIHDPTQTDGQGADIGPQYMSAIFFQNDEQRAIAEKLIKLLEDKGLKVATQLKPAQRFWKAEEYHQRYYEKNGGTPYCHVRVKRF